MYFHEAEHCRGQPATKWVLAVGLPLAVEGIFLHYTKPLGNANKNPQWTHQTQQRYRIPDAIVQFRILQSPDEIELNSHLILSHALS
jgi:hypothetical protein